MKHARLMVAVLFVTSACAADDGPDLVGAPGASIEEISIYQAVKHDLVGGVGDDGIPIVAGRAALVRVFATADEAYNHEPVLGRLTLATPDGGTREFETTIPSLPLRTDEPSLETTINFWLPADALTQDTHYRIDLLQDAATTDGDNPAAGFPTEPQAVDPMGVQPATLPLELVLVPITNNGLKPDISDEQIERYRQGFMDRYPATDVHVTTHQPVTFDATLAADGTGWNQLLNSMSNLRVQDHAEAYVYYYGVFTPRQRFEDYCPGGCILGLGFVPSVNDSYMRAAIGLGYTGFDSVETAVHEVGHNHGRQHAPCGNADAPDRSYPHDGASIGTWGLSLASRELKDPYTYTDFMGYCANTWTSDYTYKALYKRMRAIDAIKLSGGSPRIYRRYQIGANGEVESLTPLTISEPVNLDRVFTALDGDGNAAEGMGHFVPYDHLPGGVLLVPESYDDLQITGLAAPELDR